MNQGFDALLKQAAAQQGQQQQPDIAAMLLSQSGLGSSLFSMATTAVEYAVLAFVAWIVYRKFIAKKTEVGTVDPAVTAAAEASARSPRRFHSARY